MLNLDTFACLFIKSFKRCSYSSGPPCPGASNGAFNEFIRHFIFSSYCIIINNLVFIQYLT